MRIYPRGKRGTWWVDFTVPGRPRFDRSSGTTNRRQAEEWAAQSHAAEWRQAKLGECPTHTWGEAVADWMRKNGEQRRAIEDMKDKLRWLTAAIGRDTPLHAITRSFVERVIEQKRIEGRKGRSLTHKKPPKPLQPKTLKNYVGEVSKILNHAHSLEWISGVPPMPTFDIDDGPVRWLTRDEADALIAELPEHLARMATFSLATGLREANVRLLRWKQVDVARRHAWVESSEAKAKKPIAVPLNGDAIEVLRAQARKHDVWVFPVETKRRVGSEVVKVVAPVTGCSTAAWSKALERAKIDNFRWHDLRHTWASWHVQAGTPLPVLQRLGGWATLDMVQRYAHLGRDHTAPFADAISRGNYAASRVLDDADAAMLDAMSMNLQGNMGWLKGLEPSTTGITTRDSTN